VGLCQDEPIPSLFAGRARLVAKTPGHTPWR
jgi:hypothetical protein